MQLACNFLPPEALDNISLQHLDNDINIQNVYLGPDCEEFLKTECVDFAQEIRFKCLQFHKTALKEMFKRLPYKDTFLKDLSFLESNITLYNESRIQVKDLSHIAARFKYIDLSKLAVEWRILPCRFTNEEKFGLASLKIDEMWKKILDRKDFNGEKLFPTLFRIIDRNYIFFAALECRSRIFSMVTDIKTKKRNRLSNDLISAICTIKSKIFKLKILIV